jgi:uncharacterized protein (TIGR00296 family)
MELTVDDGKALIQFARENIESYLSTGSRIDIPPELAERFSEHGGAFVTLNKMVSETETDLRGCIGIILPIYPLIETIHNISISSAVEDPRFPEVKTSEMDRILIEISVLSVPQKVEVSTPEEYLEKIVIGRDGLIASDGMHKGLLLPQVPVEQGRNWDVETFLQHTCQKAWMAPNAWRNIDQVSIESFTATIFEEETPRGDVRQKQIGE